MAKQIILDLNFRVLSPTQQIFIAFPGKGYGLYSRFYALNRVFPQLPGIDLFPKRSFEEQPELLARIARARKLRNWYRGRRQGDLPSRRLSDYSRIDQGLYGHKGVLAGFFERAKKGDLVVVPPPDLIGSVLIGELRDDPENFQNITIPELFGTDEVPSRKVKWLATVPKADLSLGMLRRFPRPNAFTLLDREFYQEIFSLAYGSYSLDDSYVLASARSNGPAFRKPIDHAVDCLRRGSKDGRLVADRSFPLRLQPQLDQAIGSVPQLTG